jgi:energy-coupling factor transporter ATP-binding protein EcfA2
MATLGYGGGEELYYVRSGSGDSFVFTRRAPMQRRLDHGEEATLRATFPQVFRLETEVALPASMPIRRLAGQAPGRLLNRAGRRQILGTLPKHDADATAVPAWWSAIAGLLRPSSATAETTGISDKEFDLGRRLLIDVARIDPASFHDLDEALAAEREGEVNALIQKMNDAIARHLNFQKWWAQDREFRLLLSPREHEVAFTVRDRTEAEYSFTERSRGLRYFLSYYVQLRANRPPEGRKQLLLLDEPDAYLSGVGQQDLLRILEEFAKPENGSDGGQVIYVTHSPYLINRNAARRIRVLDKGSHDEGTRVVTDASRNHYEPLRSSLGPFVAETAFIGGANLFVEGLADQVLLAGISSHLRSLGTAPSLTFNLNEVTIVPAGSASAIPYMVYLARGRDVVRPPCVVLLDGDKSGQDAARQLRKNPAGRRAYISAEFILSVDAWAKTAPVSVEIGVTVEEPEDLIALPVAAAAARRYAEVVLGMQPGEAAELTTDSLRNCLADKPSVWDATIKAFGLAFPDEHIEKVGFARDVVLVLETASDSSAEDELDDAVKTTRTNFSHLLGQLADLLHDARTTEDDVQQCDRVGRLVRGFLYDHSDGVTRDQARVLFREIEKALEDTDEGDARRTQLAHLRRRYELDSEPLEQVSSYERFKQELSGLRLQERLARQNRSQEPAPLAESAANDASTAADNQDVSPQEGVAASSTMAVASNGSAAM